MRLWNLVTGKKAGVLNFEKSVLQTVKEGKYSSGEGRRIKWNSAGTEFVVAFERGLIVFGEDSKPKCRILPTPLSKVHQVWWGDVSGRDLLAVSTEDGRVVFFDTSAEGRDQAEDLPELKAVMQLGGRAAGLAGRVKDFEVLSIERDCEPTAVVTASSDGAVRVWTLSANDVSQANSEAETKQVGTLVGTYETGSRITCLRAFVLQAPRAEDDYQLSEFEGFSGEDSGDSGDSDEE